MSQARDVNTSSWKSRRLHKPRRLNKTRCDRSLYCIVFRADMVQSGRVDSRCHRLIGALRRTGLATRLSVSNKEGIDKENVKDVRARVCASRGIQLLIGRQRGSLSCLLWGAPGSERPLYSPGAHDFHVLPRLPKQRRACTHRALTHLEQSRLGSRLARERVTWPAAARRGRRPGQRRRACAGERAP